MIYKKNQDLILNLEIFGQPISMKNRRRIIKNRKNGKLAVVKSREAMIYEKVFMAQIPPKLRLKIEDDVSLEIDAYYLNKRSDLDLELVCDLLEKTRVIKNDRQIIQKIFKKFIDRKNPRIILTLTKLKKDDRNVYISD